LISWNGRLGGWSKRIRILGKKEVWHPDVKCAERLGFPSFLSREKKTSREGREDQGGRGGYESGRRILPKT